VLTFCRLIPTSDRQAEGPMPMDSNRRLSAAASARYSCRFPKPEILTSIRQPWNVANAVKEPSNRLLRRYMSNVARRRKLQQSPRNSADWTSPMCRSVEPLSCSTRNWMPGGTASWTGVQYLALDARYEKTRVDGTVSDCAVLVAIGILPDGQQPNLVSSTRANACRRRETLSDHE
jgi:hypothetical protein